MIFIKDGNLTFLFRVFLSFCGVGIICLAVIFTESKFWFFAWATLGMVVGYIGGYSSQAAVLKLKPFTNDPLGWRSAKASYESKDDEQKDSIEGRG